MIIMMNLLLIAIPLSQSLKLDPLTVDKRQFLGLNAAGSGSPVVSPGGVGSPLPSSTINLVPFTPQPTKNVVSLRMFAIAGLLIHAATPSPTRVVAKRALQTTTRSTSTTVIVGGNLIVQSPRASPSPVLNASPSKSPVIATVNGNAMISPTVFKVSPSPVKTVAPPVASPTSTSFDQLIA